MLDPWIIEEIRRREQEERRHREDQPVLEVPRDHPPSDPGESDGHHRERRDRGGGGGDRGVTIVDYRI